VVDHGRDTHGLPTRLSVPVERERPIPVMSQGRRIGEGAVDGKVKWTGPNAAPTLAEYGKLSDALNQAAKARSRLRIVILDGKVSAVVVPGAGPREIRGYGVSHAHTTTTPGRSGDPRNLESSACKQHVLCS
jgi:hypothetical protein